MINHINSGEFDFLHEAIGYGYYFLKRYENTQDLKFKKRYETNILHLIKGLNEIARKDEFGLKWKSLLDERFLIGHKRLINI